MNFDFLFFEHLYSVENHYKDLCILNLKLLNRKEIMKIIELIKKIILREKYNSETYTRYLRKKGVYVGENTRFYSPSTLNIDVSRPYLLKIGSCCKITAGVLILTHDYSFSVLRPVYHFLTNDCPGQTVIGNNCFLGMRSVIMGG